MRKGLSLAAVIVLLVLVAIVLRDRSRQAQPDTAGLEVTRDLVYRTVDGVDLKMDVYAPPRPSSAASVMVLYGRAWRDGSKEGAGQVAAVLARRGFAAFAPDYREAPPGGTSHAPDPYEDTVAAARWIAANARTFGADPERLGVLGWSAGGNLALLLGTRGIEEEGLEIGAVVSLSGPTDLPLLHARLSEGEREVLVNYLGCPLESCAQLWEAMSPIEQVSEESAPTFLANSVGDLTPIEQAEGMSDQLEKAGVDHFLRVVPGTGHGTSLGADVWAAALRFLGDRLAQPVTSS